MSKITEFNFNYNIGDEMEFHLTNKTVIYGVMLSRAYPANSKDPREIGKHDRVLIVNSMTLKNEYVKLSDIERIN